MEKEYEENKKKQKKALKKYRKAILKIIGSLIVIPLGFAFSGGLIFDLITKFILNEELAVFLSILPKILMIGGGALVAGINVIKAKLSKNEMKHLEDEEEEIVQYIEKEKNDKEDKVQALEEELKKVKENEKENEKKIENDNSKIATINNTIQEKYEYDEDEYGFKKK